MTKSDKIYEMFVPSVGESINEVTISSWLKSNGDYVELDEIIAEIDSDKATFELTAEASGNLIIEAEEGTTLEIGKLICKIEIKEISKEQKESQDQKEVLTENKSEVITKERSESTPVAKKIMDEKGYFTFLMGIITRFVMESEKGPHPKLPLLPKVEELEIKNADTLDALAPGVSKDLRNKRLAANKKIGA